MSSKTEEILQALFAQLSTVATASRTVLRNEEEPEDVPVDGLAILHDGEVELLDELLGGQGPYYYALTAELDVFAVDSESRGKDEVFDELLVALVGAIEVDDTLGGLVEGMSYGPPGPIVEGREGATGVKSATLDLRAEYQSLTRI